MMRKTLAILTAAAMAAGSLSAGVCVYAADDATHIYVLTAPEDHGWTGSVATFAKEKVEEVNNDGKYTAELITSANAAEQIVNIEDIVASGEDNIAVVIQPIDDTVQSAIQQLVDAEIPYVAFDRIIDGVSSSAVSNVKGDNEGIGAAAAAYFVSEGMTPGEAVYVYEGDTSSVTSLRDSGFTEYLTGELEYDGETIADDKKWTEDDLKSITYSGAMNWIQRLLLNLFLVTVQMLILNGSMQKMMNLQWESWKHFRVAESMTLRKKHSLETNHTLQDAADLTNCMQ